MSADAAGASPGRRRRIAIAGIKLVHSLIFVGNSAAILHICYVGIRDRPSRWTRAALIAAGLEVVVFVVNRGRCPLTGWVERLGAEHGRVSDVFLPRRFADRIPWLCTPPLAVGVIAMAWHRRRHRGVRSRRVSVRCGRGPR